MFVFETDLVLCCGLGSLISVLCHLAGHKKLVVLQKNSQPDARHQTSLYSIDISHDMHSA